MQRKIWSALAAAVATCTTGAAFGLTVGNPGFETQIVQNGVAPDNWGTFYGGTPPVTLVAVEDPAQFKSGLQSLHLRVAENLNAFCGAQQKVTGVVGNLSYDFKFWAKKGADTNPIGTGGTNGIDVKIEWINTAGGLTGAVPILHPEVTGDWVQYTLTATAPADAIAANLVFAIQSFTFLNPATAGAEAFFDDVEFVTGGNQPQIGSCCGPAPAECLVTTQSGCSATWTLGGTCAPNICAGSPGACCNPKTLACAVVSDTICATLGGSFKGPGTTCGQIPCTPGCIVDFDGNGTRTIDDIFIFLNAWFAAVGC